MHQVFELSMLTIVLTLAVSILPRIYWAYLRTEECYRHHEPELLQELLQERNSWIQRHLGCGAAAILLIWVTESRPTLEISHALTLTVGVYAACCLLFAGLECFLVCRIHRLLEAVPVRVQDQR